jgi:hypothetical protein
MILPLVISFQLVKMEINLPNVMSMLEAVLLSYPLQWHPPFRGPCRQLAACPKSSVEMGFVVNQGRCPLAVFTGACLATELTASPYLSPCSYRHNVFICFTKGFASLTWY